MKTRWNFWFLCLCVFSQIPAETLCVVFGSCIWFMRCRWTNEEGGFQSRSLIKPNVAGWGPAARNAAFVNPPTPLFFSSFSYVWKAESTCNNPTGTAIVFRNFFFVRSRHIVLRVIKHLFLFIHATCVCLFVQNLRGTIYNFIIHHNFTTSNDFR